MTTLHYILLIFALFAMIILLGKIYLESGINRKLTKKYWKLKAYRKRKYEQKRRLEEAQNEIKKKQE